MFRIDRNDSPRNSQVHWFFPVPLSADSRQRISNQQIQNSSAAKACLQQHDPRRVGFHPADDARAVAIGPRANRRQGSLRGFVAAIATTAPSTAVTLSRAKAEGIEDLSIFCNHVTIIPAIKAILDSPDLRLSGRSWSRHCFFLAEISATSRSTER